MMDSEKSYSVKSDLKRKFIIIILVISILANLYLISSLRQLKGHDKFQTIMTIEAYIHQLENFTNYLDIYIQEPEETQIVDILYDQSSEMLRVITGPNYFSFRNMEALGSSLIAITSQIQDILPGSKEEKLTEDKIKNLKYINNNLRAITTYFSEIESDMISKNLRNDYIIINELEIADKINSFIEDNKSKVEALN